MKWLRRRGGNLNLTPGTIAHSVRSFNQPKEIDLTQTAGSRYDEQLLYRLGETDIPVRHASGEPNGVLFLRLHSNELPAATATPEFIKLPGLWGKGELLCVYDPIGKGKFRAVNFKHTYSRRGIVSQQRGYYFDANRIWTDDGVGKTIDIVKRQLADGRETPRRWRRGEKEEVSAMVGGFRDWFLDKMDLSSRDLVVSVHNTQGITYDAISATRTEGVDGSIHLPELENIPRPLLLTDTRDYDALSRNGYTRLALMVTDKLKIPGFDYNTTEDNYAQLRDAGYNVVLQASRDDADRLRGDGFEVVVAEDLGTSRETRFMRKTDLRTAQFFFQTTTREDFEALKEQNPRMNVILQRPAEQLAGNSSFSVYCANRDVRCITMEVRQGDMGMQQAMLRAIKNLVEGESK